MWSLRLARQCLNSSVLRVHTHRARSVSRLSNLLCWASKRPYLLMDPSVRCLATENSSQEPPAIVLTPVSADADAPAADSTDTPQDQPDVQHSSADHSTPAALEFLQVSLADLVASRGRHKPPSAVDVLSGRVMAGYRQLLNAEQFLFFQLLFDEYGVDRDNVINAAQHLADSSESAFARHSEVLVGLLQPTYVWIFMQLGRVEGGVKFLVDMRADLLRLCGQADSVTCRTLVQALRELLNMWFSVGFMQLERVTWQSPCDMLEKVSEYEAVHPVRNWTDLKRRVGAYRRCFVFTHHSMPREPIVVLHTALTSSISSSIVDIVRKPRQLSLINPYSVGDDSLVTEEDSSQINTAIFYSISSTQKGLQGIELGNVLIKRVVGELLAEFPHMNQFSSLSPIPGFKSWLITEINKAIRGEVIVLTDREQTALAFHLQLGDAVSTGDKSQELLERLKQLVHVCSWLESDVELSALLRTPLMRACARYLYVAKRRGFALDSVANFHLRNGAVMWRLNWAADLTPRGLSNSCGIMVNYRYFMDQTQRNSEQYLTQHVVAASEEVLSLTVQPEDK